MYFNSILALGALVSLAAAAPLHQHNNEKRDVVWTTTVVQDVVTVHVYTTIWPGQTDAAHPTGSHGETTTHTRPQVTSHIKSTMTVTYPTSTPSPTTSAIETTPIVQTTTAAPATSTQTAAPPAITTSAGTTSAGSGGGSAAATGQINTGDITYYAPGLGSCGITNTASDMIVALAEDLMAAEHAANPNDNPLCGRSITISYGGKTAVATIEDTCPGCADASLDLTPSLFEIFAPLATGRISGVEWWYN